tara:strand:- start:6363 stop:7457 length:1095 start_codon:yes stop_codon:yes gene_type:complete
MSRKVAVILLNLGGPDCKKAIRPFLMNFFMDKNIIGAPAPIRWLLANYISLKRSKREAGQSYGELGDKSPLLENTQAQADALLEELNADENSANTYKTFVCMRYWHPMSPQVVKDVQAWGADKIVILPLYPQFSTTTTWSSLGVWNEAMARQGLTTETSMVCCYPDNEGYVEASTANIAEQYTQAQKDGHEKIRVLFSAHGLPESVIKKGDPYQWQCEKSAQTIATRLESVLEKKIDWQICYQSRVGPMKWISPSTEEAIDKAATDETAIIIYPHAFTQEHVETLVELDIEYKEYAEEKGQHGYYRAQTVGRHPAFIKGLAQLVRYYEPRTDITAEGFTCICPEQFGRCCMRESDAGALGTKAA